MVSLARSTRASTSITSPVAGGEGIDATSFFTHFAPTILPCRLLPEESCRMSPCPSSKRYSAIVSLSGVNVVGGLKFLE